MDDAAPREPFDPEPEQDLDGPLGDLVKVIARQIAREHHRADEERRAGGR